MIDLDQAILIAGHLAAVPKFPRGTAARIANFAACGKILATRCETEKQAEQVARSYRPLRWQSIEHFEQHVRTTTGAELSLADQRSYQAHAHNSLFEPLRCRDKIIGWCGIPFPAELIDRARKYPDLTLLEQAHIGLDAMNAQREIERQQWNQIKALPADQRAALEAYARKEYAGFIDPEPKGARYAMALSFEEWRKLTCA